MRKSLFVSIVYSFLVPTLAFAHNDPEEMGHHWHIPAYVNETRLQIALIAGGCLVIFFWPYIKGFAMRFRRTPQ